MYRYDVLIGPKSLMEKSYDSYLKHSDGLEADAQ